jgi:hypothetical protein
MATGQTCPRYLFNWAPMTWPGSSNLRAMVLNTSYVPDVDVHQFVSDIRAYEVAGTNYPTGGFPLSSATMAYDAPTNRTTFDAADVVVANVAITGNLRFVWVYDVSNATDATRPLIYLLDYGATDPATSLPWACNGTFTVTWNAAGIFTSTAS